jgi:FtsH-binding integral membrane protein
MTNLRKFVAWYKELLRTNTVSVLIVFVVLIPTYFVATQFTSSHEDAVFISFLVAIVIGVSFGPLVSRFLARPPTNERRR